jgi:hypothetical protein
MITLSFSWFFVLVFLSGMGVFCASIVVAQILRVAAAFAKAFIENRTH